MPVARTVQVSITGPDVAEHAVLKPEGAEYVSEIVAVVREIGDDYMQAHLVVYYVGRKKDGTVRSRRTGQHYILTQAWARALLKDAIPNDLLKRLPETAD